jgi:integrase
MRGGGVPERSGVAHEWQIVRSLADGLEWSCGWEVPAVQRLRFVLDFAYATGLRVGELFNATLGDVLADANAHAGAR